MKKILLMMYLLLVPNIVCAYENDYFSLDIPENYKELVKENDVYKWSNNNENEIPNITVTVTENSSADKQNVEKFTDSDLEKYKETIESTINDSISEYNLTVTVERLEKTKLKKYLALTYTTKWPTKESFGYDMYQKSYVITTEKYITAIVYTTASEEDLNSKEIKTVLESFKINDIDIVEEGFFENSRNQIIIVGIAAGIIGYVISALKKKKTI